MDAIVQLIRNALCCIKDLDLLPYTILNDPANVAKFYTFPSPHMDKTTPLEVLIAITQLYACISCSISGFKLLKNNGVLRLRKLSQIANVMKHKYKDIKSKKAIDIIQKSIFHEASAAMKDTLVGVCVFSIGVSFFWLFGNSLHVTAVGWIGGLPALIHALTVMEIALLPLLYLMIKDAAGGISKAGRIQALVDKFNGKKAEKDDDSWLDLETFTLIQGEDWTPIWSSPSIIDSNMEETAQEKVLEKDAEVVESKIKALTDGKTVILSNEKGERLETLAVTSKYEGYREYVYFLLNFIAFYGYLLGIICYYFDDKEGEQPSFVTNMKMGYSNEVADWTGNFAGDLMWTIEPAIILSSPMILRMLTKRGETKVKSD